MAANRAYVAQNGSLQAEQSNPIGEQATVPLTYVLFSSDNELIPVKNPYSGGEAYQGVISVNLSYVSQNVNNVIIAAVRAAEDDSSLQVYLIP